MSVMLCWKGKFFKNRIIKRDTVLIKQCFFVLVISILFDIYKKYTILRVRKEIWRFIMEQKYLMCEKCKNLVMSINDSGVTPVCCGEKMKVLIPGEVEASMEKHIPVFKVKDNKVLVSVGSVEHPMLDVHFIEWISIQTNEGMSMKILKPNQEPKACFSLSENEKLEAVYAYCNLHGLWVNKNE